MSQIQDDTQFEGTRQVRSDLELRCAEPFTIHIIPQAHIDLAWQWTADDAVEMVLETFRGHVELLEQDSTRTYAQSQLAAYAIVEREDPELFERLKALIAEGRWEVVGGEWVEPDRALPSGEAFVRQLLEGQSFAKEKLDTQAVVAWCPDSFTFSPHNLPQLLTQAGLRFQTLKRPREKYVNLPLLPFRWVGLDGTELVTLRSNNKGDGFPNLSEGTPPPPEGSSDTQVYVDAYSEAGLHHLWGPRGVGDTGGVNEYPPAPYGDNWQAKYSTPSEFLKAFEEWGRNQDLEEVRHAISHVIMPGCLTTHADMKALNRKSENTLQSAEVAASIASLHGADIDQEPLNEAWRDVLFNQFHDTITGVGIPEIHKDAAHDYEKAVRTGEKTRRKALRSLAKRVKTQKDSPSLLVFNDLGWTRTDVVQAEIGFSEWYGRNEEVPELWEAIAPDGTASQVVIHGIKRAQGWKRHQISFVAHDVPAMGWRVYTFRPIERMQTLVRRNGFEALNGHMTLRLNPATGEVEALMNRTDAVQMYGSLARPHLHEEGEYFLDYGVEHRAWYLGLTGKEKPVSFEGIKLAAEHPSYVAFDVKHAFGSSEMRQRFIVRDGMDRVDVEVDIDWHEIEHLVRIQFFVPLEGTPAAAYDSAYGVTLRPADGKESGMQTFCDLSDGKTGLALLNDGKYGAMADGNLLTLSAVRCSTRPDPRSDEGRMTFRYSMIPHLGDWKEADLMRRGYAFNRPLTAIPLGLATRAGTPENELPAEYQCISTDNDVLMPVVLKNQRNGDGLVLRSLYADSESGVAGVSMAPDVSGTISADILEQEQGKLESEPPRRAYRPFEVATTLIQTKR